MRELLPLLEKPSRYLGSEWGAVKKDPTKVDLRLALAFPDLYEVGMSYLGQRLLYHTVNSIEGFYAERVFAPGLDAVALMRQRGVPLATLETDTPLGELDGVAFHITHELCYTNVLLMIDLAGLPVRSAERDERHPLVFAGGGVTFNAEPLAPFLDFMVLGDGETALPPVLEAMATAKREKISRPDLLARLAGLPGVYVPSFFEYQGPDKPLKPLTAGHETVSKAVAPDLDAIDYPTEPVLPFAQAVHDRLTLEVARGCTRGCRFCHAGVVYRPVRERSPEKLTEIMEKSLERAGYEELSFLSLSTGDYSALDQLFEESFARCAAEQVAISLPSLRVGSVSPKLMGLMARIRRTGVTIAPEAGSQRLRDVINKGVDEQGLMDHVSALFAKGWQNLKLYFMIGLPTETIDDVAAIFELCQKVVNQAPKGRKRIMVTAAVSPFVPKPHTPFQWERQITMAETRERIDLLHSLFARDKRLKLKWHEPEMSFLEGVFSRAGRELADVVERGYRAGALFTSWPEHLDFDLWMRILADSAIDPEACLAARDLDAPLPWDHLSCGVTKEFLRRERERALEEKLTPDCRFGACRICGVCDMGKAASTLGCDFKVQPRVIHGRRDQEELSPAAPEPPGTLAIPEADSDKKPGARPKPPATPEELSVKAGHFRIWFQKLGPAAWLSTLELGRVIERALRRARVLPTFSKGFHPMPLISFGNALPVGVESRCEWFNLFTREPYTPEAIREALSPALPEGMRVIRVDVLGPGRRQPQPVAEDFIVTYTGPESGGDSWRAAWKSFAEAESFPFTRVTRKGVREMDARAFAASVELGDGTVALRLDWSEKYVSPLALVSAVTPELTPADFSLEKTAQLFALPTADTPSK